MKQKMSDTAGECKRAARKKLCSLLTYDLIARQTRSEDETALREERSNQKIEARVKAEG